MEIPGARSTYAVSGKQYIATTSGNVSRSTFQTTGSPTMVVMSIEVPETARQRVVLPAVNARGMLAGAPEAGDAAARGEQLYTQYCAGCHGTRGEGGAAPTLVGGSAPREVAALAKVIRDPPPPMPDLHPSPLDDSGVAAVAEYVRSLQAANQ